MDMEETLQAVFQGRHLYLGGPSVNCNWHVPVALKSLCGEIEASRFLIRSWEPLLEHRIKTGKESLFELGTATACVVATSLIAERAIKTLIAQVAPNERPWSGVPRSDRHSLIWLFQQKLDSRVQAEVEDQLKTLPKFWLDYAEASSVAEILGISNANFEDWRYAMEPSGATGGVPRPLLKVSVALTLVGVSHLAQWQDSMGIKASRSE